MEKLSSDLYTAAQKQSWAMQSQLIDANRINADKQDAIDQRDAFIKKLRQVETYLQRLDYINKGSMLKMEQFQSECIRNLEHRVETILALIMPEEQFKVRITFQPLRGKYVSEVYTGKERSDGSITWSKPRSANGDFIKQLVSFSIVCSLNLMLGATKVFADEPFSSSDPVNVSKLAPVFDMMLEEGLQVIIIEHKETLYAGMSHNEINLLKHRHPVSEHKGYVEVLSCERREPDGFGDYAEDTSTGAVSDS